MPAMTASVARLSPGLARTTIPATTLRTPISATSHQVLVTSDTSRASASSGHGDLLGRPRGMRGPRADRTGRPSGRQDAGGAAATAPHSRRPLGGGAPRAAG